MRNSLILFGLLATAAGALTLAPSCSNERPPITCSDDDGDGYGSGEDCLGPDCNDSDPDCHEGDCCIDCTDLDGDGYGVGADCAGPDCNDSDPECFAGECCTACTDADGDGHGEGVDCLGPDCNDQDPTCWAGECCIAADGCAALLQCSRACEQDPECVDACLATADAEAVELWEDLRDCAEEWECDSHGCVVLHCNAELQACLADR